MNELDLIAAAYYRHPMHQILNLRRHQGGEIRYSKLKDFADRSTPNPEPSNPNPNPLTPNTNPDPGRVPVKPP